GNPVEVRVFSWAPFPFSPSIGEIGGGANTDQLPGPQNANKLSFVKVCDKKAGWQHGQLSP
ncbi:MAG: hypothetical protein OSB58_16080, partial [Alphaproteobacteria bacterium]|nr:hypothetical protein [Alphaproteobacteria bacterium]